MENSIENIWKQGFLNESSLVVPKINDLYNQKSMHVVDSVKRTFRMNQIVIVAMAIVIIIMHYFVDALWQGSIASVLLLLTALYINRLIHSIDTLDQGATSFDYLKSIDLWLKDVLFKSEKLARFIYPLNLLIALSTIWSAWDKQGQTLKIHQKYPDINIPLFALIITGVSVLLMFSFSAKIYQWEVRMMYGRVFGKLKETIADMEKLKQEE
jgi:hypothetical protein